MIKNIGHHILLSSLAGRKSLTLRAWQCSCVRANDVKIMRSRDAQCNSEESPQVDFEKRVEVS